MDMFNWDLVCAASCTSINNKLKTAQDLLIKNFSYTSENNSTINGEFDSWQIVPGGSSQRINFITPIKSGRLSTTIAGKRIEVAVNGICPKIAVELQFVGSNDINKTQLKFNCQQVVQEKKDVFSGAGSVVILDDDINNIFPADERIISEMFSALMAEMIVANKEQLQFVFSDLISLPEDNNGWLQTHIIQYTYNEPINGELGALAVLAILDCNPNPPNLADLQLQFDPALMRSTDSIGFAIAKWAFLKHVILAGLPEIFKGANRNHFKLVENNVIRNNGNIPLNPINGYTPYFENALVQIVDDKIVINNTSGRCDVVYNSSYVTFSLSGIYSVSLQRQNNRIKVSLNSVSTPSFSASVYDPLALAFWIFGGWVVDALLRGIKSQMEYLLWSFGYYGLEFDVFPVTMNVVADYKECGLAENFFMRG
ncbi:MAG TPA: TULIP family P47-like protein [Arsenophonus nasoniae]|uniref:TULIP family P47-like protein n=1 Tax=Arsenophonus nasoniae TaxID=638 RepID=UPI00387A68EC